MYFEAAADIQPCKQVPLTWLTGWAADVGAGVEFTLVMVVPGDGIGEGSAAGGEGGGGGVEGSAAAGNGGSNVNDPDGTCGGGAVVERGPGAGAFPPLPPPNLSG